MRISDWSSDVCSSDLVARQASQTFDRFWNSERVLPASRLDEARTAADLAQAMIVLGHWLAEARTLSHFELAPQAWRDALGDLVPAFPPGSRRVHADSPGADQVPPVTPDGLPGLPASAVRGGVIPNAHH